MAIEPDGPRPYRIAADGGQRIRAFGDLMIIKATASDTGGRLFVMEQHVPRHRQPPGRHVHATDDQAWFVIAGHGRFFIGGETIPVGPRDFVSGPHGVPHAFSADTDELHVLVMTTPAGLERFFAEVGAEVRTEAPSQRLPPDDAPEPADIDAIAQRYGVTALGPEPLWTPSDEG